MESLTHTAVNLVGFTRSLVDIDSTTGREGAAAAYLSEYLTKLGFTVVEQKVDDHRFNVFATSSPQPAVVYSTHFDCVPPFFPSRVENGRIYGRGSCDAKGILAAQVAAADLLRREGETRVGLLFVVGEERGSEGAKRANLDARGCRYLVNGEPTDRQARPGDARHPARGAQGEGAGGALVISGAGRVGHRQADRRAHGSAARGVAGRSAARAHALHRRPDFGRSGAERGAAGGAGRVDVPHGQRRVPGHGDPPEVRAARVARADPGGAARPDGRRFLASMRPSSHTRPTSRSCAPGVSRCCSARGRFTWHTRPMNSSTSGSRSARSTTTRGSPASSSTAVRLTSDTTNDPRVTVSAVDPRSEYDRRIARLPLRSPMASAATSGSPTCGSYCSPLAALLAWLAFARGTLESGVAAAARDAFSGAAGRARAPPECQRATPARAAILRTRADATRRIVGRHRTGRQPVHRRPSVCARPGSVRGRIALSIDRHGEDGGRRGDAGRLAACAGRQPRGPHAAAGRSGTARPHRLPRDARGARRRGARVEDRHAHGVGGRDPVGLGPAHAILFAVCALVTAILVAAMLADGFRACPFCSGCWCPPPSRSRIAARVWRVIRRVDAAADDLSLLEALLRPARSRRPFSAARLGVLQRRARGRVEAVRAHRTVAALHRGPRRPSKRIHPSLRPAAPRAKPGGGGHRSVACGKQVVARRMDRRDR